VIRAPRPAVVSRTKVAEEEENTMADPTKGEHKKLTRDESELRNRADQRETRQHNINTLVREWTRLSHSYLIRWLRRERPENLTAVKDYHPYSPYDPAMLQLADMDTLLHPITPYPHSAITPVPFSLHPDTGDIDMTTNSQHDTDKPAITEVTQEGQPANRAATYQDEINKLEHIQQELVERIQASIRAYYHAQEPKCMPLEASMSTLNMLTLGPLDEGKYFRGTHVLIKPDPGLDEEIVCR